MNITDMQQTLNAQIKAKTVQILLNNASNCTKTNLLVLIPHYSVVTSNHMINTLNTDISNGADQPNNADIELTNVTKMDTTLSKNITELNQTCNAQIKANNVQILINNASKWTIRSPLVLKTHDLSVDTSNHMTPSNKHIH